MSKAIFNLKRPIRVQRLFPERHYNPRYDCRVRRIIAEDSLDGQTILTVSAVGSCFVAFMPSDVVWVALERPL